MQYPANAKIITFCFFEGATLSVPVGTVIKKVYYFTPPDWTAPVYISLLGFSILSLFVWSLMSFSDQPFLASLGLVTSLSVLATGILFPQL
jgi:hypothetical protein